MALTLNLHDKYINWTIKKELTIANNNNILSERNESWGIRFECVLFISVLMIFFLSKTNYRYKITISYKNDLNQRPFESVALYKTWIIFFAIFGDIFDPNGMRPSSRQHSVLHRVKFILKFFLCVSVKFNGCLCFRTMEECNTRRNWVHNKCSFRKIWFHLKLLNQISLIYYLHAEMHQF